MPDARLPDPGPRDLGIADALSALPLETPARSAWPALAERIAAAERARRPRPRWPFALAAAAALAVVALLPRGQLPTPAPAPAVATAPADAAPTLDALMSESARLENLIGAVAGEPTSASAMAMSLAFEDELQRIDATLSDPGLAAADRSALWNRRVALLRDYAGIQGTTQWLAAEGGSHDGDLVAVF